MLQLGFGVLCDNAPCGIWPVNLHRAQTYVDRMKHARGYQDCDFKIVPIFVGEHVDIVPPAKTPKERA